MKYKVGQKVKVREDLEEGKVYGVMLFNSEMKRMKGQVVTICHINDDNYELEEDECKYGWTDEMFEGLAEYTYKDLCKSPVGTKIMFENEEILYKISNKQNGFLGMKHYRDIKDLVNLKDNIAGAFGKIIKIEEPQYTTVYEAKDVLDEKEREYLSNVIKPFRDKVECVIKYDYYDKQKSYLIIKIIESSHNITFPDFLTEAMYKGMEAGREYSLEELNLS